MPATLSKEQIKIDDLSDDQIRQLVAKMQQNGIAFSQIDEYAAENGIPDQEVEKLKARIQQLGLDKTLTGNSNKDTATETDDENVDRRLNDSTYKWNEKYRNIRSKEDFEKAMRRRKIFGTELFSNENLTFEPNLRMPTPPNYRIAADDELIIDVYGYSDVQHRLKVTPEGYVRIPYLGPVYVNGLTMDEARNRITKQLAAIYGGIKSGKTMVQVSLGNIRSLRVMLIGEIERPGSYTLPSLATVANALYVSGGPNENGSFRNIQVIRNGQPIDTFDLYTFLQSGDLTHNIVLQDQDIVKVNPYKTRVELMGEVKRPAIFEAKENETLQNMLDYAGGYTDSAYHDVIKAFRVNDRQREVVNIPAAQIPTFKLRSGDKFIIDSILNRFGNRVSISGAVFHPGNYALEDGMTVGDLIRKADGVQEVAALSRGIIRRLQADYTPAIINFNVQDALSGRQQLPLQREDSVVVFSKLALREAYQVKIGGEVNQPGYYSYGDSMRLEDLVLLAGGLKDAASLKQVEISRRIRSAGNFDSSDIRMAIIRQFNINADLSSDPGAAAFALQPFDEVMIRKSPAYKEQANVEVDGEVAYPGQYTINTRLERISDVLRRAGGLRPEAYPEGAVLLRKTFVNSSDSALLLNKLEVFYNKMQDTARDSANIAQLRGAVERKEQLLGINLEKIIKEPGSKYDLLLEEGDILKIPKRLQAVQLFGEIYFPKKVRYNSGSNFRSYIRGAGGFTSQALKRRSYIVYANGEVKNTRKVLFFNNYPKVKPGAEIYVPSKKEHRGLNGQEAIGLASGLASIALIIVTIINRTR